MRPVLRLRGPLQARDATWLLALAPVLVAARMPMGFLLLLGLPLVVVLVQGVRPRAAWPRGLKVLLGLCLVTSFCSLAVTSPSQLPSPQGNFLIMVGISLAALAVFGAGRPRQAADRLFDGIHLGLLVSWFISVCEAATGIKMMTILYPGANTAAAVASKRFYVSALFPNYNDYSVAMTYLCLCTVAGMVFHPRVPGWRRAGRWLVLLSAAFFIVYMGSRGCLGALLVGLALLAVISIRSLHERPFGIRLVTISAAVVVIAVVALATSKYVNDHSTASRGVIAGNIWQMMLADPLHALLGWGSYVDYHAAAAAAYGDILMDPHNVLLELVVWYGVAALVGYAYLWLRVVHVGVVRPHRRITWRAAASVTIAALMPLVGVVCSSTLRYHLFWLWLVIALFHVQQWAREARDELLGRTGSTSLEAGAPEQHVATGQSVNHPAGATAAARHQGSPEA